MQTICIGMELVWKVNFSIETQASEVGWVSHCSCFLGVSQHWILPDPLTSRSLTVQQKGKSRRTWQACLFSSALLFLGACEWVFDGLVSRVWGLLSVHTCTHKFECMYVLIWVHLHACQVCLVFFGRLHFPLLKGWLQLISQTIKHLIFLPRPNWIYFLGVIECQSGKVCWKCQQGQGQREKSCLKPSINEPNDMQHFHPILKSYFYRCLEDIYMQHWIYELLKWFKNCHYRSPQKCFSLPVNGRLFLSHLLRCSMIWPFIKWQVVTST